MDDNQLTAIPERTPGLIAGEIRTIKEQAGKILLVSAIEIGRRLIEAKEKIPYGQFGTWLEDNLQYSERTAYNLMRIAEAYEPRLSGDTDSYAIASVAGAKTEPLAKLGYSQALILLGLPAEERMEFIAQLDLENTAVRELQQAVSDRNKALAEKEALQKEHDAQRDTIGKLSQVIGEKSKEANDNQKSLWAEQAKVTILQRRLDTMENESAAARRIAEIERESQIAKINLSMAQADARFDLITKGFDDLCNAMKEMAATDPNSFKLYLNQMNKFITQTSNRLKRMEKSAP